MKKDYYGSRTFAEHALEERQRRRELVVFTEFGSQVILGGGDEHEAA